MFLLKNARVKLAFSVILSTWLSKLRLLWIFRPRYLAVFVVLRT
jgi:hypothetical protein